MNEAAAGAGTGESRTLQLADGRMLGYAEYGAQAGFPVFVIHGTPGCRFMFRLADEIARNRGFRLIAPDRPGYGLSAPHPDGGTDGFARDVAALAGALGLDRFALAGVSGGGPYAAACAALYAERVAALALISPVGPVAAQEVAEGLSFAHRLAFSTLPHWQAAGSTAFTVMRQATALPPAAFARLLMTRAARSDAAILLRPEIASNITESVAEGLRPGVSGALEDMRAFAGAWEERLKDITTPARVWQGTDDRNVPVSAARRLAEAIPGCELTMLEGAGHYWVFDHFGEVLDWIAAHTAADG